jgi:hypothetical protein
MKRIAIGFGGLVYGFLLMWLCLTTLSKIDWPRATTAVRGCHELGKCPTSWWAFPVLFLYIIGPPMIFAFLNAIAWKRWSLLKWGIGFCILTFTATTLYLSSHML